MSDSPKPYVVRQGDTLLSIALASGLEPDDVWSHAKNAELAKRRDPDILAPGDVLYLPPPPPPELKVKPRTTNTYKLKVPKVDVTLSFQGEAGPLAGEPYVVTGLWDPLEGKLDATGGVKVPVPVGVEHFVITFPKRGVEHPVWIGHLDPMDQPSGVQARLLHLGHLPIGLDVRDPYAFPDADSARRTLMAFQRANGLEPTGFADEATQKKLEQLHGS